jgi:hypothetical protein
MTTFIVSGSYGEFSSPLKAFSTRQKAEQGIIAIKALFANDDDFEWNGEYYNHFFITELEMDCPV